MGKRLMMVICLVATLALAGCLDSGGGGGSDDSGNNGNNGANTDAGDIANDDADGVANNGIDSGDQDTGFDDVGGRDGGDAGNEDTGDQDGGDRDTGDEDTGAPSEFPETVTCDRDGFTPDADGVSATAAGALFVEAVASVDSLQDAMSLQIFPDLGTGAANAPGTYQLDDFNYATCVNCLLIYAGCNDQTCQKTFIAGEGMLDISSAGTVDGEFQPGEQFTATLTDAKLVEVTIDYDADFETEIVAGGEGWCIDSFSWDVTLEGPDGP